MRDDAVLRRALPLDRGLGPISLGGFCLGKGTTLASFHSRGTYPSQREALKMAVKGSANQTENSRRNQLGSWSGPQDLCPSILPSLLST